MTSNMHVAFNTYITYLTHRVRLFRKQVQYFYEHYLTKCIMLLPTSRTLLCDDREHTEILLLLLLLRPIIYYYIGIIYACVSP